MHLFRMCSPTICSTLRHWPLATTTSDANAVDDIALLGLISQAARLVRARWTGSTVDDVQLAEL